MLVAGGEKSGSTRLVDDHLRDGCEQIERGADAAAECLRRDDDAGASAPGARPQAIGWRSIGRNLAQTV
jgi:hypothetical protein